MLKEYLLLHWQQVRTDLVQTVHRFSDGELTYEAFPGSYTVAQIMLHIPHEESIEVHYGLRRQLTEVPDRYDAERLADKDSILAVFEDVHTQTLTYLDRLSDADLEAEVELAWGEKQRRIDQLWHVLEHEIHHRGELSLILGLLGREGLDA